MTPPLSKGRLLAKVSSVNINMKSKIALNVDPLAYNELKGSLGVGIPN